MLNNIKSAWRTRVAAPISNFLNPAARWFAARLLPLAKIIQPAKEKADESWARFSMNNPKLSVWIRRGTKLVAAFYAFYFIFAIGVFGEIPTVEELREMQTLNTSEVYTANGALIGKFYKENRKDIRYEDIPQSVVDALVATEDHQYWEHSGVDFWALGRVFYRSLLRGDESGGGGSTVTQQLAKNLFGRKKFFMFSTAINKVREMLIARRLERAYDKKDLMAFYFNTVPFGSNVFGLEMAAKRFFNKTAKELRLEEGATLVGMLQSNTRFNPKRNAAASLRRRNIVLNEMVEFKKLDRATFDKLKNDSIHLNYQPVLNRDAMASYFKDYLRTVMPKLLEPYKKDDGTPYDIYKDGLKVYTSIDSTMQVTAEAAVAERMSRLQQDFDEHWSGQKWWGDDKYLEDAMHNSDRWKRLNTEGYSEAKIRDIFTKRKFPMTVFGWENGVASEREVDWTPLDSIKYYFRQLNTGFMVMDPTNGLVKAWVGGTDFNFFQYDHVRSRRQVGSTFKPIVYAKAIQSGIRPCEYVSNRQMAYLEDGTTKRAYEVTEKEKEKAWMPRNSDESYSGSYSLEGALTNSVNVVSANLIYRVGVDNVRQLAKDMGVTTDIQRDLSIALGTADISLFDMMKVYGTFAARGKRPEPVVVLKVTTRDGKIIADFQPTANQSKWQQALSTDHADMMIKMMKSVVDDGTAGRLRYKYDIKNDIAGKTGTTQNHADGWFMCFTPNLVCGAWVGGMVPSVRFRDIDQGQGAYMALPISGIFLQKLYKTPQYSAMKDAKFAELPKWIKDSMACEHKMYSAEERLEMDSVRQQNDTLNIAPSTEMPQQPASFDNDLRGNPDGDNGNAPTPRLPQSASLPASTKPEIRISPTATKPTSPPKKQR